jgi:hypothetical protein
MKKILTVILVACMFILAGCIGETATLTGASPNAWGFGYQMAMNGQNNYYTNLSTNTTAQHNITVLQLNNTAYQSYITKIMLSTNDSTINVAIDKCNIINASLVCTSNWTTVEQVYVTKNQPVIIDYSQIPIKIESGQAFKLRYIDAGNSSTSILANVAYFNLIGR